MGWSDHLDDPNDYDAYMGGLEMRADAVRKGESTIGPSVKLACGHTAPLAEDGTASCTQCPPHLDEIPF